MPIRSESRKHFPPIYPVVIGLNPGPVWTLCSRPAHSGEHFPVPLDPSVASPSLIHSSFITLETGDGGLRERRLTLRSVRGSSSSEAPPHTTATAARFYPWDQRDRSSSNANIEEMIGWKLLFSVFPAVTFSICFSRRLAAAERKLGFYSPQRPQHVYQRRERRISLIILFVG